MVQHAWRGQAPGRIRKDVIEIENPKLQNIYVASPKPPRGLSGAMGWGHGLPLWEVAPRSPRGRGRRPWVASGCVGGTRGSCFNDVLAIPVAAADSVTVPDRVLCDLQTETGRHGECT